MANRLDELAPAMKEEGREVHVIAKQLPVEVGVESDIFEIMLWVCGVIPGVIFQFMKISAQDHFDRLEQKIQRSASSIDNYLEQRVMVLENCARLVNNAIELDKNTFESIAKLRSGTAAGADRSALAGAIESAGRDMDITVENYPQLMAHKEIREAMQQNLYLQREISAARELYNDAIDQWNRDLFSWPTKKIVAARNGYTTRLPFAASKETKEKARATFF